MTTGDRKPVAVKNGETELIKHGSWGSHGIGDKGQKWKWTMELWDIPGAAGRGYIEWDIPDVGCEEIGLWYEMRGDKRALVDYDGIMSLPAEAAALIESAGIIVDSEFKT
jgi:hypothetical protein